MVIRNIFIGLTLIWMTLIYGISINPSNVLERLSMFAVQLMDPVIRMASVNLGINFINGQIIQEIIMKSAHFGLFATLGLMTGVVVGHFNSSRVKAVIIAFGIGVLFSASVELRTVIVQGGSFHWEVLLVDSLGVLKGLASYMGLVIFGRRLLEMGKSVLKIA